MAEVTVGQYVLELSVDYGDVTPGALDRIRDEFAATLSHQLLIAPPGCTIKRLDVAPADVQMERLLRLLALSEQEREFVRAALEPDVQSDLFGVLGDYLEEGGKQELAERMRQRAANATRLVYEFTPNPPESHRYAFCRIQQGYSDFMINLPKDAKTAGFSSNLFPGDLCVLIEHHHFPEVALTDPVPEIEMWFRQHQEGNLLFPVFDGWEWVDNPAGWIEPHDWYKSGMPLSGVAEYPHARRATANV